MSRVFFVTGRGRSGTWLLQSILSRHPDICLAPESVFALILEKTYGRRTAWDTASIERFVCDLFKEEKIPAWWGLEPQSVKDALHRKATQGSLHSYQDVCHTVYTCYASKVERGSVSHVGDKNPEYSLYMERLLRIFPDALFLHMVRDPRDTVLSYQKVSFDLSSPVALAERWRCYNHKALAFAKKHPDHIRFLKFEELLTSPQKVLEECFTFLGLPTCPDILERTHASSTILSYNENIRGPLDPERCEQWKKTPEGTALPEVIHNLCREEIRTFGYEEVSGVTPTLRDRTQIWIGRIVTGLEARFFSLPPSLSLWLLSAYRKRTGVLEQPGEGS